MAEILKIPSSSPHDPQPTVIKLKYDNPKEIEGKYGTQYMYGVTHQGQDKVLYATTGLHRQIEATQSRQGDELSVIRTGEGKETRWSVLPLEDQHLSGQPLPKQETQAAPTRRNGPTFEERYLQYGVAWDMAVDFLAAKQSNADVNAVAFTFYKMAQDAGHNLMEEPNPKE